MQRGYWKREQTFNRKTLTKRVKKGKCHPRKGNEEPEEEYLYSFFILGARWGWVRPRPSRFTLEKGTRYPLYRRLGGQLQKIFTSTGIQSPDRTACSESLYRLSYPGPLKKKERRTKRTIQALVTSCAKFDQVKTRVFRCSMSLVDALVLNSLQGN
jgi:hypothetical protein